MPFIPLHFSTVVRKESEEAGISVKVSFVAWDHFSLEAKVCGSCCLSSQPVSERTWRKFDYSGDGVDVKYSFGQ